MKNKRLITYSRKEIIDNPQLLLNKFEYYINHYDSFGSFSLIYYFKVTEDYIFYYRIFILENFSLASKITNKKEILVSWFNKKLYTFF